METINLIQPDAPLRIRKIVLYPYPDLTRLWFRLQLDTMPTELPHIDVGIWNADGTMNSNIAFVAYDDSFVDSTIHLHHPVPAAIYVCTTEITAGMPPEVRQHDFVRFSFPLEFRDAQQGAEGFGYNMENAPA